MGRSRGGLTTKIHAVVDAKGLPIRLGLTPGQAYDGEAAMELLNALPENAMVLADKAYDANAIREMINGQGAWANIPPESNRKDPICFSRSCPASGVRALRSTRLPAGRAGTFRLPRWAA